MATLTFIVYCLSQHLDVLLTLREEILTKIGPTRRPTIDDIKDCKYLRAVINGTFIMNLQQLVFDDVHQRDSSFIPCCVCSNFSYEISEVFDDVNIVDHSIRGAWCQSICPLAAQ